MAPAQLVEAKDLPPELQQCGPRHGRGGRLPRRRRRRRRRAAQAIDAPATTRRAAGALPRTAAARSRRARPPADGAAHELARRPRARGARACCRPASRGLGHADAQVRGAADPSPRSRSRAAAASRRRRSSASAATRSRARSRSWGWTTSSAAPPQAGTVPVGRSPREPGDPAWCPLPILRRLDPLSGFPEQEHEATRSIAAFSTALAAVAMASPAQAAIFDVTIDGPDAIWLAGRTDLVVPPASDPWPGGLIRHGGNTPEEAIETIPSFVAVAAGDVVRALDAAVGGVNFFNGFGPPFFGPSGNESAGSSLHGLRRHQQLPRAARAPDRRVSHRRGSERRPPGTLDFSTPASRELTSLTPAIGQVFYIGDGKTSPTCSSSSSRRPARPASSSPFPTGSALRPRPVPTTTTTAATGSASASTKCPSCRAFRNPRPMPDAGRSRSTRRSVGVAAGSGQASRSRLAAGPRRRRTPIASAVLRIVPPVRDEGIGQAFGSDVRFPRRLANAARSQAGRTCRLRESASISVSSSVVASGRASA